MPRRIKTVKDPYEEVRKQKGIESRREMARSFSQHKCPYCGENNTSPQKNVETDGFLQYKCNSCYKTFGKKI